MGIPDCIGNQNLGSFMHLDLLAVTVNSISLKRKKYSLPCSSKIKRLAIYGAQFTNWWHLSILLNAENMKQETKQGTPLIISDPQNSAQDATVWNNNFSVLSNLQSPKKYIFHTSLKNMVWVNHTSYLSIMVHHRIISTCKSTPKVR